MARKFAERLLSHAADDNQRLDLLFTTVACRPPTDSERMAATKLLTIMRARFEDSPQDAQQLLSIGEVAVDPEFPSSELAAWSQVAATVLASDLSIMLY